MYPLHPICPRHTQQSERPTRLRAILALLTSLLACLLAPTATQAQVSVLTQHNDNARTGANLNETILTPQKVQVATFGKLFTRTLDANVNGQVLYVPALTLQGKLHNVLYASTSNNSNGSPCSVYAFDADDPNAPAPLWRHPLPPSAQWTTATPVIDPATNTLYLLTKDNNDSGPTRLRALDLITGNEKTGSPLLIAASVPGTGDGSVNGVVSFDTTHANCRPALLLLNGIVYVAFAHNTDSFPYHGWILGYSYDQTQFTQRAVFCTNPNGGEDGIWMAGKGLAVDVNNNLYCTVGNGTFDLPSGGSSYGMCILKLTPSLQVVDWFAPFDEAGLSNADLDLGNSGVVGIPGTTRMFAGGTKFGSAFVLDSTNLGHFTPNGPDQVVQRLDHLMSNDNVGQNPVCWDGGGTKYVYLWPSGTNVLQFKYDPMVGRFNPGGVYKQSGNVPDGGSLGVSANGSLGGILWGVGNNGVLHAFDATDVSRAELWNSRMNAGRDALPSVGHFQFPTIANGKVYIPTGSASIVVYGLLQGSPATTLTPAADAYVRANAYANSNFGTSTQLISKKLTSDSNSPYNRAAYLKFDLTKVTVAPAKATLQLTVNSASIPAGSSENLQIYSVANTAWTETGITWNNAPGLNRANFTSTGTLITTTSVVLKAGTISIDLTAFVAANLGKMVTLQLMDATSQGVFLVFDSREAGSSGPQLAITP